MEKIMSHLTSNTKFEYVALYYYLDEEEGNVYNGESAGYDSEYEAVVAGEKYVKQQVEDCGRFAWVVIETRIVPIYI